MVSFKISTIDESDDLKHTVFTSFVDASMRDYGHDRMLPPGVNDGSVIDKAFDDEKQTMYTISEDNDVVGGIIVEIRETNENYLQTLWIKPGYQNQGIGNKAMQFIEDKFPNSKSWVLETPKKAVININFYEKWGYRTFEEKTFGDVTLVFMRKENK